MGYNYLKVYPLQSPRLVPLNQAIGSNFAVNSSPCPWSSTDLSTKHCPSGLYLLWHGLIYSHSRFKVYLLQRGLIHGPPSLQGCTCCVVDFSTATDPLRCSSKALCTATDASRCTYCGMDVSTATDASSCPAPTWTYPQVTVLRLEFTL